MKPFAVTESCHGMKCIQGDKVPIEAMEVVRGMVLNNWMDSIDYKPHQAAGAFLQTYCEDRNGTGFIMVEFWHADYMPFVEHVNNELRKAGLIDE